MLYSSQDSNYARESMTPHKSDESKTERETEEWNLGKNGQKFKFVSHEINNRSSLLSVQDTAWPLFELQWRAITASRIKDETEMKGGTLFVL